MFTGGTSATGWQRFLPGLAVLTHYDRAWLRPDLLAGVTVAAYLVPQVMAYAQIAGLPPVAGLWGMCAPLLVYALVGGSRQLSVGPESTTALMTAAAVGTLTATTGVDRWADTAALLAVLVGLVCLIGWVLRLGFLASLLSKPVLQGYLIGVAVLMIASQLGKVTRLPIDGDTPVEQVASLLAQISQVHLPTLAVAGGTLGLIVVLQALAPRWPGPLIAMVLAGGIAALPLAQGLGLSVVGAVPLGLPPPRFPDASGLSLTAMLPWAIGIALVGYSDNVLVARAFATRHRQPLDAGQEMMALGAINLAAGVTNGFPCSSSGTRTVLGDTMGAKTQVTGLVVLGIILLTLVVAGPVLATFPIGAMGGIIIYAACRLFDLPELRRVAAFRRSEFVLVVVTAVAVVALGVLSGIGIAVALSLLDLIRRISRPNAGVLGYVPGLAGMHDVSDWDGAHQVEGLVVFRYDAPLFFVNSADFLTRALAAVDEAHTQVEWVVINAEANVEADLTAVDTLVEFRRALADRGVVLALARVKADLRARFDVGGLTAAVGAAHIFATLPSAVAAYAAAFAQRHGRPPAGLPEAGPLGRA